MGKMGKIIFWFRCFEIVDAQKFARDFASDVSEPSRRKANYP
jgi:hypothetical protein